MLGIEATVEKITGYAEMAQYGIASTPGIVIGGKVALAGSLPKDDDLKCWLQA